MVTYNGSYQEDQPWELYGLKDDVKPIKKPDGSGETMPNGSTFWVIDAAEDNDTTLYMFDEQNELWVAQN